MGEIEQRPTPGSRLGAPENSGISTLEHGQKPPPTPSGKLMSIKIQMLDDTQEAFEVPVSWGQPSAWGRSSQSCDARWREDGLCIQQPSSHPHRAPLIPSGSVRAMDCLVDVC